MILNALLIALREIRRNLTRSFLTVIGIVIGVAAVVTMVTLGRGATESVKSQISKMGSNLLTLRPGQGWGGWGAPQFSIDDYYAVRDQVPGIAALAPFVQTNVKVVYEENDRSSDIQGTTPIYFKIANWEISTGRIFPDSGQKTQSRSRIMPSTSIRVRFVRSPTSTRCRARSGS